MSGLTTLLGETLTSKDGPVQVSSLVKPEHVVGLYFTKRGCSACQKFMPQLLQWYQHVKDGDNGTKLEIVYIGDTESQEEFDECYGEMPWTALPYGPNIEEMSMNLYQMFRIPVPPTLVFVEAETGLLINRSGRFAVERDKTGENHPWAPRTLPDILSGPVLSNSGDVDLEDARKDKVLGIYFSSEWCGPCQYFTPELIGAYNNLKKVGKDFEVVFVSWDDDEKEFDGYRKDMPWVALPFNDGRVYELGEHFDVDGIPTLIILDENLELLTRKGTRAIGAMSRPEGQEFVPPPLLKLNAIHGGYESKTLIFCTDGKEDLIAQGELLMQEVAEETAAATKASLGTDNELVPILMLIEDEGCEEHLYGLGSYIPKETLRPCMVYMDLENERRHVIENPGDLTKEDFREIVSKIRDGTIETVPLPPSTPSESQSDS